MSRTKWYAWAEAWQLGPFAWTEGYFDTKEEAEAWIAEQKALREQALS